jgi:hypothetical protein
VVDGGKGPIGRQQQLRHPKHSTEQEALLSYINARPGAPMKSPKANVVMIRDPDGNSIAFAFALALALDSTMAH